MCVHVCVRVCAHIPGRSKDNLQSWFSSFATCVVSFPVNLTQAEVNEEEGTVTEKMSPLDL